MPLLDVNNISISFGGLAAVSGFSFHVEEGEIVSIIGPNGAGKTTVFNMLTGVYKPDAGSIKFDGVECNGLAPQEIVKLGIARTFQNIRLYKDMRVIENVIVGMHINQKYGFFDMLLRTKKFRTCEYESAKRAQQILEMVGLSQHTHDYAKNLPYGEQRKLEIARAIATSAKLLILDEPAAGMNTGESESLMHFIRTLKDKGFTILLIEHDMNVVMNISDRIYVLNYGKKIAEGLPEEIVSDPQVITAYLGVTKEGKDAAGD